MHAGLAHGAARSARGPALRPASRRPRHRLSHDPTIQDAALSAARSSVKPSPLEELQAAYGEKPAPPPDPVAAASASAAAAAAAAAVSMKETRTVGVGTEGDAEAALLTARGGSAGGGTADELASRFARRIGELEALLGAPRTSLAHTSGGRRVPPLFEPPLSQCGPLTAVRCACVRAPCSGDARG